MMLATLPDQLVLSANALTLTVVVVFLASLVRGFAGFGLSALIMASLALIIPPKSLIPLCLSLELIAGLLMARGGFAKANLKTSWGLALFSSIGLPIGLAATISLPTELSKAIAMLLILALAGLQFQKRVPAFLGTTTGLCVSGLAAGISAGLASVGGLVVALFVLAQRAPPAQMRASLVVYLFLTMFTSMLSLALTGLLTVLVIKRALILAPAVIIGVGIGSWLFKPSLEHWYKRFCLYLLMTLATVGLARLILDTA